MQRTIIIIIIIIYSFKFYNNQHQGLVTTGRRPLGPVSPRWVNSNRSLSPHITSV